MSDRPDWGQIGIRAQERSEVDAAKRKIELERAREDSIARDAFRDKSVTALKRIKNVCERNCQEYNAKVSEPRYRVVVSQIQDGFVIAKGNGVVHASFTLERSQGKSILLSRENTMTPRNIYSHRLEAIELDGVVRFGKVALEVEEYKDETLADEACLWVMNTEESA